jgi:hypothetical protein
MSIEGNIQDAQQLLRLLNNYDRYLQVFDKSTYKNPRWEIPILKIKLCKHERIYIEFGDRPVRWTFFAHLCANMLKLPGGHQIHCSR